MAAVEATVCAMEGTVNCASLEVLALVAAGLAWAVRDASEGALFVVIGMGDVEGAGATLGLDSALVLVVATSGAAFLEDVVGIAGALILTSAPLATGLTLTLEATAASVFDGLTMALATVFVATGVLTGLVMPLAAGLLTGLALLDAALVAAFGTALGVVLDTVFDAVFTGALAAALTGVFATALTAAFTVDFFVAIFIFCLLARPDHLPK